LQPLNPGLVYCSITGFGQTGPYAGRAGYDFMIQGMGGIMSVTGQPEGTPGAEPLKCGVAFADIFTGLYATIGITAALAHRERTGEGQHIDMALLDCQVAVLANQALNYLVSGSPPVRHGNAHPNIVPYQAFATADGHVILAIGNDRQFACFCRIAGLDDLPADPRFLTNRTRVDNRQALVPLIAQAMTCAPRPNGSLCLKRTACPAGPSTH
jgi:crotonobetainyl-CoA:carnitine CoA-transferase CaiB-like acyl-CoA transferase